METCSLKLSTAIRLGCTLREPGLLRGQSCALAAAFEAIGRPVCGSVFGLIGNLAIEFFKEDFPILFNFVAHPVTGNLECVAICIIGLNDHYGWSRLRIADWIESIERKEEPENSQSNRAGTADQECRSVGQADRECRAPYGQIAVVR